jgi:putative zinc finger/helix-turn-helix YgiT family protein
MARESTSGSKGNCPACGRRPLEERYIRDEFDYGPDDERIRVVAEAVPVLVCPACEEVFYGSDAERAHHRAICRALELLTPEQIRAMRERLGMSQAEFAQLTGIGVATLSRWEQGRLVQTRSLDNYLQVLDAIPHAIRVLEKLRDRPPRPPKPWRSLRITDEIRSRLARFQLHLCGADLADGPEPGPGVPGAPAREVSAGS